MRFTNKQVNALLAEAGINGEFRRGRGKEYIGMYVYTKYEMTLTVCSVRHARHLASPLEAFEAIRRRLALRVPSPPPASDVPDAAPRPQ